MDVDCIHLPPALSLSILIRRDAARFHKTLRSLRLLHAFDNHESTPSWFRSLNIVLTSGTTGGQEATATGGHLWTRMMMLVAACNWPGVHSARLASLEYILHHKHCSISPILLNCDHNVRPPYRPTLGRESSPHELND